MHPSFTSTDLIIAPLPYKTSFLSPVSHHHYLN
jgi:hypothetical protein